MTTERERRFPGPKRGQLIFSVVLVAFAVFLLVEIPSQTRWVAKTEFFAQPRFWPAAGIVGMLVFGLGHLARLPWRRFMRDDRVELLRWTAALEFAAWFMAYVVIVPIAGYLPTTLVFVAVLSWRLGYRSPKMFLAGVVFAVCTVLVFKTFLSVKIPGGEIYEYLPGAVRSFFILNF